MDDHEGASLNPEPIPPQHTAPAARPNPADIYPEVTHGSPLAAADLPQKKKTHRPLLGASYKKIFINLIVAVAIAGAGYALGYKVGHNAGYKVGYAAANSGTNSTFQGCQTNFCPLTKPVIYLYPSHSETVSVQLRYPAGLGYTDPLYNPQTGWQVLATPSGQLTDMADGQQYPNLVWEGNPAPISFNMHTGFVVPGDQTATFLQKELTIIGLSPSEINAYIAYWQPAMSKNPYNLIHFAGSEYTNYAKLLVSPTPNSVLRVFMVYKPLQQPVSVTPQTFPAFHRTGFTVVEWGGTERPQ
jgi:hypothetical protein